MNVLETEFDIFEQDPDILKFNYDPLALSCCLQRSYKEGILVYPSTTITDNVLVDFIDLEDQIKANHIREYYGRKFFWRQLQKRTELSKFRTEMLEFIHSDNPKEVKYDTIKIIHKLPEFYEEDLILDNIKKGAKLSFVDTSTSLTCTKTLTPKGVIHRRAKRDRAAHYWLWDEQDRLCELTVEAHNSLEHLWLDIFNNSSTIKIHGYFFTKERDNFNYYTIANWTLEK